MTDGSDPVDPEVPLQPVTPPGLGRRELQERAVRGAGWTMIHTVTGVPIAFLVNLLLARVLGVVDYGRLAYLMTLIGVVGGIVGLGVTTGTIQFGSKAHAAGRHEEVRFLLSQAQGFRLAFVAPIMTVVVIFAAHVSLPLLLVAIVVGIWLPGFFDGATTCLVLENKTDWQAKIAMGLNLLLQAGTVVAVLLTRSADAVWAVRLAIGGLGVALAMVVIDRRYRAAVLRPRLPRHMPAGFWKFVIPTAAASLIGMLALSRTEVFVLQWLGDAAAVGVFALAFGLASHIFSPAQALVGPLIPAISGLREVDADAVKDAFRRTMRASSILVGAMCVIGLPALALLIPVLYGHGFDASAPMLVALGISSGLLVVGGPVSAFVMGRLDARTVLWASVVALAIDAALAFALVPVIGGWGAVIANVAGAFTRLLLLVHSELRAMVIGWYDLLRQVSSSLFAFAICALAWWGGHMSGLPDIPAAVAAAIVGSLVWIASVRVARGGLQPGDVDAFVRVLPERLRPAGSRVLALISVRGTRA